MVNALILAKTTGLSGKIYVKEHKRGAVQEPNWTAPFAKRGKCDSIGV